MPETYNKGGINSRKNKTKKKKKRKEIQEAKNTANKKTPIVNAQFWKQSEKALRHAGHDNTREIRTRAELGN